MSATILMIGLAIEAVLLTAHALALAAQEDKAMGELRDKVDELERKLSTMENADKNMRLLDQRVKELEESLLNKEDD